ncbi:MAG TPA: phosphoheptose isomerase [Gammaproteobacteria bacterium]|nr:phosphoheptose isomerase [Gammaproteobacteria bacterium]
MESNERVSDTFLATARLAEECARTLPPAVTQAAARMAQAILQGNRILTCGNGGSAAEALHFSSELLNRFERERPPLPAIALCADSATLTCIGNDYDFNEIFAKQVRALAQPGDILLALTTSGRSPNIVAAIDAAHAREAHVVLLSGRDGGDCGRRLGVEDTEIRVPASNTARIQEVHLMVIHHLCDAIDNHLFAQD